MKSCNPRHWPELRFAVGVLLVALVALAVTLLTRNIVLGIAAGFVMVFVDLAAHRARGAPGWREFEARVWLEGGGVAQFVVVGERVALFAKFSCTKRLPTAMIAPLLPASLRSVQPSGRVVRGEMSAVEMRWEVAPQSAGPTVIPGLLIVGISPFGLFRSVAMAPARTVMFAVNAPEVVDALLPLLKRQTHVGEDRRRFVRGGGTDFRELRQYQPLDPLSRIDWKATARRSEVIVRDMEEPRELTIAVVLDASSDLTHGLDGSGAWFERTLLFLASLADVARRSGIRLVITTYDADVLHHLRLGGDSDGVERLLAELADLPYAALWRHAAGDRARHALLDRRALQRLGAWGVAAADVDAFLDRYSNGGHGVAPSLHALLADVEPTALLSLGQHCARCDVRMFADELACPQCGARVGDGSLTPRANSAAAAIVEALHRAHGRQVLVFVSALSGGETAPALGQLLARAQAQHRVVHVVAPSARELLSARPQWPGSLGHGPVRRDVLRDIDRLSRAADFTAFRRALHSAGIAVHALDDSAQLNDLIHSIMERELHVA